MRVKLRDIQKQLVKELVGIRRIGAYNLGFSGIADGLIDLTGIQSKNAVATMTQWMRGMEWQEEDRAIFQLAMGLDAKTSALDVSSRRKKSAADLGVSDRTILRREDALLQELADKLAKELVSSVQRGDGQAEKRIEAFFSPEIEDIMDGAGSDDVPTLIRNQAIVIRESTAAMKSCLEMLEKMSESNRRLAKAWGVQLD